MVGLREWEDRDPSIKRCLSCGEYVPVAARECNHCDGPLSGRRAGRAGVVWVGLVVAVLAYVLARLTA